jgi:hypothetical protein
LEEAYSWALTSHQAKVLTSTLSPTERGRTFVPRTAEAGAKFPKKRSPSPKVWTPHELKKLEGTAREKALREGLCLGCGSKDHFISACPKTKRMLKVIEDGMRDLQMKGKKKFEKRLKSIHSLLTSDSEFTGGESEEESTKEETEEETGNSDPESEG